jgi:hypothetical protein
MKLSRIAVAGFAGLVGTGALAFQGEEYPVPPAPFQSTQSRADVQEQARTAPRISNGGTGVMVNTGTADRAGVRAGAVAIAPQGAAAYADVKR